MNLKNWSYNPWSNDGIHYYIDFTKYASVYGTAWRLPFDFKINYCIN